MFSLTISIISFDFRQIILDNSFFRLWNRNIKRTLTITLI